MNRFCRILVAAAGVALAIPAQAGEIREDIRADMPGLLELYRDLHAHPELSHQEHRTAGLLAGLMRESGFDVTEGIGGTGVVAMMRNGEGPVLLVRTDMDGLPVDEQTGLPFASKQRAVPASGVESGVMHACGHDTHMTAWIAVGRLLAARRDEWSGTLMMIAQPAEELGEGAAAMLADGLYERFARPDFALAFHDAADAPAGMVGYTPGFAMANVDSVDITVHGVGGHGAYPQATKDPIVLASAIVTRLQTLVSRESNPLDPSVVTVGSFHAGTKHNIISDTARLQLTVRSYSEESRKRLLDGIARIARGEAIAAGLPEDKFPDVIVDPAYTPAVFNSPEFTARVAERLTDILGAERVTRNEPVMGGEDFSQYRRADPDRIQSVLIKIGGVPQDVYERAKANGEVLPSLHSPFWAPDAEAVIATGAEALTAVALEVLAK